ncbi:MAG TPA: VC0807 family protein [Acidimicrobiia bacterium]|nr:VC0807 family protein [Acidimicrobiia bacterium]
MPITSFQPPPLLTLARHAVRPVLEGVIIPLALFYAFLWQSGVWGAITVALIWSWGAVAYRLAKRQRVPGILMLGALGMTVRTVLAVSTQSVFFYFLQPTLGTVVVAGAFLLSVPAGRPLAARLAEDFLPMPDAFREHPAVRRYFLRITLLWALVQLANAALAFWLLISQPVPVFLAAKTAGSLVLTGAAIAVSTVVFFRSMRRHGLLSISQPALPAGALTVS